MSISSTASEADKIHLEVGERNFVATAKTLTTQSGFFSALLSDRWGDYGMEEGPYFVDVDGDVFEHILRYLRSDVLPIFYTKSKGPDYRLYSLLLEQATYFKIPRLEKWIRDKTYLEAVTVSHTVSEVGLTDFGTEKTTMDWEIEYCFTQKAQKDQEPQYEDENLWSILMIRKKTEFNQQICMEGGRT